MKQPTLYAVQRADGDYLRLAHLEGAIVAAWVLQECNADTWPSATEATLAAMDPQGANLCNSPKIDWTVIAVAGPDEDEDEPPRRLTRQERLQGLADRGIDTWEDYRGEK